MPNTTAISPELLQEQGPHNTSPTAEALSVSKKKCSVCRICQPLNQFSKDKTRSDGHNYVCKNCGRQYRKLNAEDIKEKKALYRIQNFNRLQEYYISHWRQKYGWIAELRSQKGCWICNEKDRDMLSWHHIDSDPKSFNLSSTSLHHRSTEEIMEEIDKCIILCYNHHNKFHRVFGMKHNTQEQLELYKTMI